jgi:hypothetical protein
MDRQSFTRTKPNRVALVMALSHRQARSLCELEEAMAAADAPARERRLNNATFHPLARKLASSLLAVWPSVPQNQRVFGAAVLYAWMTGQTLDTSAQLLRKDPQEMLVAVIGYLKWATGVHQKGLIDLAVTMGPQHILARLSPNDRQLAMSFRSSVLLLGLSKIPIYPKAFSTPFGIEIATTLLDEYDSEGLAQGNVRR